MLWSKKGAYLPSTFKETYYFGYVFFIAVPYQKRILCVQKYYFTHAQARRKLNSRKIAMTAVWTVCVTDLGKLNLLMVVKLEPMFATAPAATRNDTCFKKGQNRLKNNHLAILT